MQHRANTWKHKGRETKNSSQPFFVIETNFHHSFRHCMGRLLLLNFFKKIPNPTGLWICLKLRFGSGISFFFLSLSLFKVFLRCASILPIYQTSLIKVYLYCVFRILLPDISISSREALILSLYSLVYTHAIETPTVT